MTDSAIVSPTASWNPSLAPSRNSIGSVLIGALVEVVPELVVNRREVFGSHVDAHLDAQIVFVVDVPGARVADDFAIARLDEERPFPERLGQRSESERGEEALADTHHLQRLDLLRFQPICQRKRLASSCRRDERIDVRPVLLPEVAEQVGRNRSVGRERCAVFLAQAVRT